MKTTKRLKTGDLVKVISGSDKGKTGKITKINTKENTALVEGLGNKVRHIAPNRMNPKGGKKDIQVGIALCKLALVVDEKSGKTSRVGLQTSDGKSTIRIAKQDKNKEIK